MKDTLGVVDIGGQDKGLVAGRDIPKGARIFCEGPLFSAPRPGLTPSNAVASPGALREELLARIKTLSKGKLRQFFSLPNYYKGQDPLVGIFLSNFINQGSDTGVYALMSQVRHSCLPNAAPTWNPEQAYMTLHAFRPIRAGEVITMMYNSRRSMALTSSDRRKEPPMLAEGYGLITATSDVRKQSLKDDYGIECDCLICSLPPCELQLSDDRRLKMQQRYSTFFLDYSDTTEDGRMCLAACRNLYNLLVEEYGGPDMVDAYVFKVYQDASRICNAHGDEARASAFAGRAYRARLTLHGDDHPQAQRWKHLAECPESADEYL
jgi:hypothetical protein